MLQSAGMTFKLKKCFFFTRTTRLPGTYRKPRETLGRVKDLRSRTEDATAKERNRVEILLRSLQCLLALRRKLRTYSITTQQEAEKRRGPRVRNAERRGNSGLREVEGETRLAPSTLSLIHI